MQWHSFLEERERSVGVTMLRCDVNQCAPVLRPRRYISFVLLNENLYNMRVTALGRDVQGCAVNLSITNSV